MYNTTIRMVRNGLLRGSKMNIRIKFILSYVGAVIATIVLYIFLHELGHFLVAVACGAKNAKISIMSARMISDGGNYNQITGSLFNLAGMLLPVLICFISTMFYNQKINNIFYKYFSLMFSVMTISSIIAWVIIPLISIFSTPPKGDDVTNFINTSQLNPLIVILVAIFLITIMVLTASIKGIFKSFLNSIRQGFKGKNRY